ncbi:MAG: cadmium-translocating P-type ATPase [Oscillospiraceae bacterium]|jgi:Cd2+/Zn2+-exporting ATPase|nr:cadmium-translocating P-type ATPase [Oscillospiraceae bacterium]
MKINKQVIRILISAALLILALAIGEGIPALALYLAAYALIGYDILWGALQELLHGMLIGEAFLMSIATVGAFAIGEYPEGVLVMLLYQIGEYFQGYAVNRSRKSIATLMDIRPDEAIVLRDGEEVTVSPEEVAVGETLVIRPGDRVALDARVLSGESALDTAALTGESVPRGVAPGDALLSGCVNLTGRLTAIVEKPSGESTASRILDLVENAGERKSRPEQFITRFARIYTPVVVALAALLAVLPPLLTGQAFSIWIYRALSFLVVSCPCALVISVPLSFFGGIGGASRRGVLVKGGSELEALARASTVVFDKTGTLTQGVFEVQTLSPVGVSADELLELAALAESASPHPIARSLLRAYGEKPDAARIADIREMRGLGVSAQIDGQPVLVGSAKWLMQNKISVPDGAPEGTLVHVARDGAYCGHIVIADALKPGAKDALQALRAQGVSRLVMLTGDRPGAAHGIAAELGIDEVRAELLPEDKVNEVERLLADKPRRGRLAFVGDGMNDAPVLRRADVGVAMGALGSDAAIEAADVVIMDDTLQKLPIAIAQARRTLRIAGQNIAFALLVKGLVLVLSALGLTSLPIAVFADVGVTILAVLNAMRAALR